MTVLRKLRQDWILYIMLAPPLAYFVIFHLIPIFGMRLAFQDYRIVGDNVWVGFKHFDVLFSSPAFFTVIKNTLIISTMKMVFGFPVPIILAILVNEVANRFYRKYVQSIIYLPHFLSWVVIAGIWIGLLNPSEGAINLISNIFGASSIDYMTSKDHIRWVFVVSEIWRSAGWDSIIYLAAIMKISPGLYEAAKIDGANRLQSMLYITLPQLYGTIVTVFILNLGFFMSAGFDQVFNMMNDSVISVVDILDTYVYRIGIVNGQFAYSTAASLFKGVIGIFLILGTHFTSKKVTGNGLW